MEDFELESKSYFFPNRLTLFEQVSQSLSRLISEKKWRPGEMLPNETELAQMFNVSPGTMRRALKLLVDKGVLIRHQGKGPFVAEFSNNLYISATLSCSLITQKSMKRSLQNQICCFSRE